MTEQNKEEAAALAKKARSQGKAAVKNVTRAAKVAAEPVVDAVAEEVQDTTQKFEGTAEDTVRGIRRINPRVLSRISGDTGVGFLALSVALYAGTIAYSKFHGVYVGRKAVMTHADRIAASTPHGYPSGV